MAEGADIEIVVDLEVGDGAADTANLTSALAALQRTTDLVARGVVLMAEGQRNAGAATRAATQATTASTTAATAAATATVQFTQRIGAAANAIQSLTAAFGQQGATAGLVGRTAASTAAFAQLGSALGPGGALVGGIVGAAIPAFQQLSRAEDVARVAATRLTASLGTLIARTQDAYSAQDRLARLQSGGGTIAEQSAYTEAAANRAALLESALGGDPGAIREVRRLGLSSRGDSDPSAMDTIRSALGGGAATQLDESEREFLRGRADVARDRVRERIGIQEQAIETQTEERTTARTTPRGGGGGSSRGDGIGDLTIFRPGQNSTQELDATASMLAAQEELRESLRMTREQRDADAEAAQVVAEAQAQHYTDEAAAAQRLFDQEKSAFEERAELTRQEDERLAEIADRRKEHMREQIEQYQEVTGVLVNGLVKAAEAIADGSQSAADAFKGLLGSFLQYISQRAALEAAAEFAQAIGSFASYQYAAGAQHLAAGALWAGVAVATGVGGAALSRPSAPSEGPARPPSSGSRGGDRGSETTVINFNSPVVTAQTEAGLGRTLREVSDASERRFPGD